MIMDKKGMDISLNFIILAVLALIALIVIALFFTGGLTNLFKQTEEVGSVSAEKVALAKSECELYCTSRIEQSWNNPDFSQELLDSIGASGQSDACETLTGKTFGEDCLPS